ncbi:MAG: ATP-dependent helicase [Caldilineaceae bacterium]
MDGAHAGRPTSCNWPRWTATSSWATCAARRPCSVFPTRALWACRDVCVGWRSCSRGRFWYADLYARFEQERLARGLLTFDDMLATGWLMLAQHADILAAMQQRYDCVLVDEFQDVNRAQAEILTCSPRFIATHIRPDGDDDQTIYTWRGASPFFIRSFRKRHRATVYFMTDNFRSRAVHLALLANQVIWLRAVNARKSIWQLTQGFGGSTVREIFADEAAMAQATAQSMQRHHRDGIADEMAVLVRGLPADACRGSGPGRGRHPAPGGGPGREFCP